MFGIENKLLVLKLNKNWKVIGQSIVSDALVDLAAGINSCALDIDYGLDEKGEVDFRQPTVTRPVNWAEWITLPIRSWDFSIRTAKLEIRVPTILVAKKYDRIPMMRFGKNPSAEQIRIRDGYRCQYTGRKLTKEEASIDHVFPKSRGGDNSWQNLVTAWKKINTMKGNMTNAEAGLKLRRKPVVPKPIPRSALIREIRHPDWSLFLEK